MTLVHIYAMSASTGGGDALAAALGELGVAMASLPGAQGTQLLRDRAAPLKFLFLEFWADEESRKAASSSLPGDIMARIMANIAEKPTTVSYDLLLAGD